MKVTLLDGTTVEGTREELADYLPPPPRYNWDGSPALTCVADWVGGPFSTSFPESGIIKSAVASGTGGEKRVK